MRLVRAILPVVRTASTTAASSPNRVLRVGDAVRERRHFTGADVAAYAAVSGDRNPVHLDDGIAREVGGFQRGRVVHGMLVASVFPSVIAAHFPGALYASQTLRFAAPVYVGDEVVAQVRALHIRMMAGNGSTSRVKFETKCFTGKDEGSLAIDGEAMAVLPTLDWSSETAIEKQCKDGLAGAW
ncbi:3-hydroxyacyl-[acyl-carrier-protein] dehydratase, mitochondrial-like isoform X2 [Miscanthus floridulus]|uniref:3-hydroxyacyl-[acyl-carrier-protein] dehydratase, mitochondrial-like isoform X2 n=1 Tax=Miscanthus floridulus TaxID=154761 RepID=UPI00345B0D62